MNAFDIPAQSCFLRSDSAKSKAQQSNERAWQDGSQSNHRGSDPVDHRKSRVRDARDHVATGKPRGRVPLALDLETARRLYAELGSYRAVAKIMGVHMVTLHRRLTGRASR